MNFEALLDQIHPQQKTLVQMQLGFQVKKLIKQVIEISVVQNHMLNLGLLCVFDSVGSMHQVLFRMRKYQKLIGFDQKSNCPIIFATAAKLSGWDLSHVFATQILYFDIYNIIKLGFQSVVSRLHYVQCQIFLTIHDAETVYFLNDCVLEDKVIAYTVNDPKYQYKEATDSVSTPGAAVDNLCELIQRRAQTQDLVVETSDSNFKSMANAIKQSMKRSDVQTIMHVHKSENNFLLHKQILNDTIFKQELDRIFQSF